jgi:capsular exopolysaccharide synthesis family protein
MVGVARPRPSAVAALTPKDVLSILRRHILLIVSLTILGLIIGGAAWKLLEIYLPKYAAQTYIRVLPPVEKDPMTIAAALVGKDIQYGHRVSMANLIRRQSTLQELVDRVKVQETEWFKHFGKTKAIRLLKAFLDLEKNFGVFAHRDAEFIVLSMTCGDAEEAALIVNEMVELFLYSQKDTKSAEIAAKLTELNNRRLSVLGEFNAAEQALALVRTDTGITDLDRPLGRYFRHTIEIKLDNLELEKNNLTLLITQAQAQIENLKTLATDPISDISEQIEQQIEIDPVMVVLAQQLAFAKSELAGRLTKFGENHRVVRQSHELISEIKEERQIRKAEIAEQTRQANLKNAQDRLFELQQRSEELERLRQEVETQKQKLDLARVTYEQRAAIRDERKRMLEEIMTLIESYRVAEKDPETPKVQFAGYAPAPLKMVSTRQWWFFLPSGTILGFIFGLALVLLIEVLNDLVRTPRDVGRYLRIPLLGVIPDEAEDRLARGVDLCHVVRQAPYSIISESYRRLRANLKLSGSAESLKVLLVSSGAEGDGKTSVAVNLAEALVAENKKVLLIDANFRRPSLQTVFPRTGPTGEGGERFDFGLSTLLTGLCAYQDIKRPNVIEGLDIIEAGQLPSNPTELLSGGRMEQLIKDRRRTHDYIIIDGPPVLLVSDAKLLASLVDGTILVFNAGATRRGAAQRTIREFREVNSKIVGCVLFAARAMKGGYFREQFKSYRKYQKLQLARSG